jgi:hypothetical protein
MEQEDEWSKSLAMLEGKAKKATQEKDWEDVRPFIHCSFFLFISFLLILFEGINGRRKEIKGKEQRSTKGFRHFA